MTLRLPMPAETLPGMAADSAFITVSASWLPGQKRAMVGAGKVGLARQPLGATMVIGRISPAFTGMWPWISVSSSTERMVSQIAMSAVPSSGMLIGRSGTCGAVPVRSTTRLSSFLVMVTTIGSSFFEGSSLSR